MVKVESDAGHKLIMALQQCRQEAARLKLWSTYRALGEPLDTIGWEIAEREEPKKTRKT